MNPSSEHERSAGSVQKGNENVSTGEMLARIPSMTKLLSAAENFEGLHGKSHRSITAALRESTAELRERVLAGKAKTSDFGADSLLLRAARHLQMRGVHRLRRVINATGVVLHTNLGRSVLPESAIQRIAETARGYCNLEIDLESGQRGRRGRYVEQLLCELTGADSALVVNNNAAATMLALRGLAAGREVIVSRGQLIEIGGSFRLPDVMTAGGAVLREVGTTNKTRVQDYEAAINEHTGLILHVHTSNYRIVGFTESPSTRELAELAHRHSLPMMDDLGSGALFDDDMWRVAGEPNAVASLACGADVVCFSGDKLLGGPQAGILLGKRPIIEQLRRDPMARALRVDKMTIAAMEAVLELYQSPQTAKQMIPLLSALTETQETLLERAEVLLEKLKQAMPDETFLIAKDDSFAGGGSMPAWPMATAVVIWKPNSKNSLEELTRRLRIGDPSVLVRTHGAAIHLDLRTISPEEYDSLAMSLAAVAA